MRLRGALNRLNDRIEFILIGASFVSQCISLVIWSEAILRHFSVRAMNNIYLNVAFLTTYLAVVIVAHSLTSVYYCY